MASTHHTIARLSRSAIYLQWSVFLCFSPDAQSLRLLAAKQVANQSNHSEGGLANVSLVLTGQFPTDDPHMNPINQMRAEMCAEMRKKYSKKSQAYKDCKDFMDDLCIPGSDERMDGDRKEQSSGSGLCAVYFPAKKKKAATTTTTAPVEEESSYESTYEKHPGEVLGEALPNEADTGLQAGEERCDTVGDECAGLTCDEGESICSLRSKGPLKNSSGGNVSFMKPILWYAKRAGSVLMTSLDEDKEERDVVGSQKKCDALGSSCGGFTCDKSDKKCTLRAPGNMTQSTDGEITYMKPIDFSKVPMQEYLGAPAQGFAGEHVEHEDNKTQTADWQEEDGLTVEQICASKPDSDWCRRMLPPRSAAAWCSPYLVVLTSTALALIG